MTITFIDNDKGSPVGKLADVELHFTDGDLEGLKLIGFALWARRTGGGLNLTFPSRAYSVNGERRSFALLRAKNEAATTRLRDLVVAAWEARQANAEAVGA